MIGFAWCTCTAPRSPPAASGHQASRRSRIFYMPTEPTKPTYPRDVLDALILWSDEQGIRFEWFCDKAKLKGTSTLYLPKNSKERSKAQRRRNTLLRLSERPILPEDFDVRDILEPLPFFDSVPATMPSSRTSKKSTSPTADGMDELSTQLSDASIRPRPLPRDIFKLYQVYAGDQNHKNLSNAISFANLTDAKTRDGNHCASAGSVRVPVLQFNHRCLDATGELEIYDIGGETHQVVTSKQWIHVNQYLEEQQSASEWSNKQFGQHGPRQDSHTAHFFKAINAGKYEADDSGHHWLQVKVVYVLPKSYLGNDIVWSNNKFNEELKTDLEGKLVYKDMSPNSKVVQMSVSICTHKVDLNTKEDYDDLDNEMDYEEKRKIEKFINSNIHSTSTAMISMQLLVQGTLREVRVSQQGRSPPRVSRRSLMMAVAADSTTSG